MTSKQVTGTFTSEISLDLKVARKNHGTPSQRQERYLLVRQELVIVQAPYQVVEVIS
jgi:hypothetical protein